MSVKKVSKLHPSFTYLDKMSKTMKHKSIYSSESAFLQRKKGKVVKAFLFNIKKLDFDRPQDFLRH